MDDGILQAWLDGPRSGLSPLEREGVELHLSECERCSRRVEEMRNESLSADALLSGSDPAGEKIPPFDDVLARARQDEAARRRRTGWTRAGWAATVAAAGVVGWMANGVYTNEVLNRDAAEAIQPTAEMSRARADAAPEAGLDADAAVPLALEDQEAPSTPVSEPSGSAEAGEVAKMAEALEESEDRAANPARVVVRDTVAADLRLGESAVTLEQMAVTGAPAENRSREVPEAEAVATRPAAEPGASMDAVAGTTPTPWLPVSRDQAEALIGFSPLTVPDLAVVRIEVDTAGEGPLVRVLQDLGGGGLLEMVQGIGSEHTRMLVATQGGSRTTMIRGGVLIVAAAPVAGDVLDGLLQRLR